MKRLRCLLGFHRYEALYRDTGDPARQYVREVTCLFCGRVRETAS